MSVLVTSGIIFVVVSDARTISIKIEQKMDVLQQSPRLSGQETKVIFESDIDFDLSAEQNTRINDTGLPARHIGFLKVEKASSTTISGIFLNFGIRNNLTFALPRDGLVISKSDELITTSRDGNFDILAVHVGSKDLFDNLLRDDSYVKFAVVRHPLQRMISAAYFYRDKASMNNKTNYLQNIPDEGFIHHLINQPTKYEDKGAFTLTRNHFGKSFGFQPETSINDKDAINQHLKLLSSQFKLVLVTERLDESLVLMKRILNWSLKDIIYFSKNVHSHEDVNITNTEEERFRKTSFIDYAVYEYFSDILDQRIRLAGEGFQKEVEHYKNVLQEVKSFCEKRYRLPLNITQSLWNRNFLFSRRDCNLIRRANPAIIESLRKHVS